MLTQRRQDNIWKLNTQQLYTPPFRRGIPWILAILIAFEICVFGAAVAFAVLANNANGGVAFAHWVIIPLITLIVCVVDALHRYQRTLGPYRAVATAAGISALWLVFIFLGLLPDYVDELFAIFAAPGLAAGLTYLVLASMALFRLRRRGDGIQKDVVGGGGDVELSARAGQSEAVATASMRSGSSGNRDGKAVNVEEQVWSPLR